MNSLRFGSFLILAMVGILVNEIQEIPPPTVHEDGRVTFQRSAPDAENVALAIEGQRPVPMAKSEEGVWSVTTSILPPDIYAYHFLIDGKPADDPANDKKLPVISGGSQGLLHIPGDKSLAWERGDEPQGRIETLKYESDIIGEPRQLKVYLPPSYKQGTEYPVLYLLHGVYNDEQAWTAAGRANVILDNLIEAEKSQPMIVVMPQGYGFANAGQRVRELLGPMNHKEWMERFAKSLMKEIIPLVEARYSVRSERDSRAIAGLSMGGAQALFIGLNHPDTFGKVGCMSSAFMLYGGKPEAFLGQATKTPTENRPKLWISSGTEDFVYFANKQVVDWLRTNEVEVEFKETAGGHTWGVWRRALVNFAPSLFR